MNLNTRIYLFSLLALILLVSTCTNTAYSQIVSLAELSQNYDVANMVSIEISGSYNLNIKDTLDKAVKAVVTNTLDTSINKVHLTVLLSKNLQSLKDHIKMMEKGTESGDKKLWAYSEDIAPGAQAQDEQFISFNQPIRKHNKANRKERENRTAGTHVDTIWNGTLPLPASDSIEILQGKNIRINKKIKTGIYRLAIVLSYPDQSGISLDPKITKMHYLIVHND